MATDLFLPPGRQRRLAAGDALFREGDPSIGLVVVRAGTLELRRNGADGRMVVLHRAGAGETIAEASLFAARHHCDAVAVAASEVSVHGLAALRRAAGSDPELPWRIAAHLAAGLMAARGRAARLAMPGADDRLLDALLALRPDDGGWRRPPSTWKALAGEIGISHETLYRRLAHLAATGRIRRQGGRVRLRAATPLPHP
jgi:CRP-like cAMP-binding protein